MLLVWFCELVSTYYKLLTPKAILDFLFLSILFKNTGPKSGERRVMIHEAGRAVRKIQPPDETQIKDCSSMQSEFTFYNPHTRAMAYLQLLFFF